MSINVRGLARSGAALAGAALLVGGFAACGSDDSSTSSSSPEPAASAAASTATAAPAAKAPTGEPIKVGSIIEATGQITYPDLIAAVKAGVAGVNDRGGINGRPLELVFCDEGGSPNTATACARKLVSEKVVAEIGGQSVTAEAQIGAVLQKAGIPQVGDNPNAGGWSSQENEFLLYVTENTTTAAAFPQVCAAQGMKKLGNPNLAVPVTQALGKVVKTVAAAKGVELVAQPQVELTTTDYAPLAQKLQSAGVDCILPFMAPSQVAALTKAQQSLGASPSYVVPTGSVGPDALKSFGAAANKTTVLSPYPIATDTAKYPVLQDYQDDVKAHGGKDASVDDPNTKGTTINSWLAVQAVAKVLGESKATTAAELMAALQKVDGMDLGFPTPWSPNTAGPASTPRVWNGTLYPHKVENGEQQPGGEPVDVLADLR